jgi:hypothetical protein
MPLHVAATFYDIIQGMFCHACIYSPLICVFFLSFSVAVLTQENGVAATMAGSGCHPNFDIYSVDNCTVVVQTQVNGANVTYNESCDVLYAQDIPGSNLYFFSWFCLLASANITLRWKAAQALQFAQAAQVRATTTGGAKDVSPSDRDSEYEDAVEDDEDAI